MTRSRADLAPQWRLFHTEGCSRAREALILGYSYLVPKTRERLIPQVPFAIDVEDLQRVGSIALIRAVDRFEPTRGVQFESFAIAHIRGGMLEYLRQEDWAPRSVRTRQRALQRAEEALLLRGEEPTGALLAAELSLSPEAFAAFTASAEVREVISWEQLKHRNQDGSDEPRHADCAISPDEGPEALLFQHHSVALYARACTDLRPTEALVTRHYVDEGWTLRRIAGELGRSESRVYQVWEDARIKLRIKLRAELCG